jgi:protein TonB
MHALGYPIPSARGPKWTGLVIVLAAHAAVLAALMSYAPAREAFAQAMPLMVDLIKPPELKRPEPPKPKPVVQPKPLVQPEKPLPPLPQITAAPVVAPSPVVAPPPPPPPRIEAPVVAAAPPTPPPAPVVPPRFDAAYLENPAPSYPALSRRMREQGRVVLRVLVTPGGTCERIELRASSGSERLDQSALETVKRWRFVPAKQGSEAVPAWVLVPISFSLEG